MDRQNPMPRRFALARGAVCAALTASLCACASIIHTGHQDVAISSVPSGGSVRIDHADYGKTPVVANLSRKSSHVIQIEMPGFQPYEATLNRTVSGWVFGNLIVGGPIGLAVDAVSGGMYKLSPAQVTATLNSQHASVLTGQDGVYVLAVLTPDPGWVKVGQLARE